MQGKDLHKLQEQRHKELLDSYQKKLDYARSNPVKIRAIQKEHIVKLWDNSKQNHREWKEILGTTPEQNTQIFNDREKQVWDKTDELHARDFENKDLSEQKKIDLEIQHFFERKELTDLIHEEKLDHMDYGDRRVFLQEEHVKEFETIDKIHQKDSDLSKEKPQEWAIKAQKHDEQTQKLQNIQNRQIDKINSLEKRNAFERSMERAKAKLRERKDRGRDGGRD